MDQLALNADPLMVNISQLGALVEACHYQAVVRLAMRVPLRQPVQVNLIGATTSRLLGLTGPDEPGVVWLLGGLHMADMPYIAWQPSHRLRP